MKLVSFKHSTLLLLLSSWLARTQSSSLMQTTTVRNFTGIILPACAGGTRYIRRYGSHASYSSLATTPSGSLLAS